MNNIIKKFNIRKISDMEIVERLLCVGPAKFGASYKDLIEDADLKISLSNRFLYYYRLLELSSNNLKLYRDDKEIVENINESIVEIYKEYESIIEKVKKEINYE